MFTKSRPLAAEGALAGQDAPLVRAEGLVRDFGRKRAVEGVSLAVEPGQVVALMGPNGAGKTTLLKLLAGFLEPTGGAAWLFDEPSRAPSNEAVREVAVLLDGHEPPSWATPERIFRLQKDASPHFDSDAADYFLRYGDLSPKAPYGTLSKGQKRWVLAGIGLASGARVLLLDEPADGLDPSARADLYERIRQYATDREAAVIVATHLVHDIERVADVAAVLVQGRLALYEALDDLRERVREVDVPAGRDLSLNGGAELLGSKEEAGYRLIWVRLNEGSEETLHDSVGAEVSARPVDLQTLYLALTKHAINAEAPTP